MASVLKRVRNLLYFDIADKCVFVELTNIDTYSCACKDTYTLLDKQVKRDVDCFKQIYNEAYGTFRVHHHFNTNNEVLHYLDNHMFLQDIETYFYLVEGEPVGMISVGLNKSNSDIGSLCAIAVRESHQNKGIGKQLLIFGISTLCERGVGSIQNIIASKRTISIMNHFKVGFKPMFNIRNAAMKQALKNTNIHQRFRLKVKLWILWVQYKATVRKEVK